MFDHNPVPAWLQIAQAVGTTFGVIFTALGVLAALYVAVWREPRKARDERNRYDDQMAALQRAEDDRIAAQARKIVPEISSGDRFGENVWLAHIENASTGVISSLKVVVKAYDSDDNEIPDAVSEATGQLDISGGIQRIISDALGGGLSGVMDSNPIMALLQQQRFGPGQQASFRDQYRAIEQQIGPQVTQALRHAMMGQLQKDWPPSLGPGASTTVAYRTTRPGLRLHIGIGFQDEAGYLWHRVNTDQPIRVDRQDDS